MRAHSPLLMFSWPLIQLHKLPAGFLSPGLSKDIFEARVILAPSASDRCCRLPCERGPDGVHRGLSKPQEGPQAPHLTWRTHQIILGTDWEDHLSSLSPSSLREYLDTGTDVRAGGTLETDNASPLSYRCAD